MSLKAPSMCRVVVETAKQTLQFTQKRLLKGRVHIACSSERLIIFRLLPMRRGCMRTHAAAHIKSVTTV